MRNFTEKYWTLISAVILGVGGLWIWWSAAPEGTTEGEVPAPMEGFLAPDFELLTLEGEPMVLSDLRGKAVLVHFWASWCPTSRSVMPAMQEISEIYGQDEFVILAVNRTDQDSLVDVGNFVAQRGLTFPILLDSDGVVAAAYQVRSLPTSFFIDPEGMIQEIVIGGPMSEALLRTRVEKLLQEAP